MPHASNQEDLFMLLKWTGRSSENTLEDKRYRVMLILLSFNRLIVYNEIVINLNKFTALKIE